MANIVSLGNSGVYMVNQPNVLINTPGGYSVNTLKDTGVTLLTRKPGKVQMITPGGKLKSLKTIGVGGMTIVQNPGFGQPVILGAGGGVRVLNAGNAGGISVLEAGGAGAINVLGAGDGANIQAGLTARGNPYARYGQNYSQLRKQGWLDGKGGQINPYG